ncbi:MAG: hypothetical protein HQL31_00370 [Planctomycetes bacterium]|nr:hypothetical protein [Planctomycetota bacterium]
MTLSIPVLLVATLWFAFSYFLMNRRIGCDGPDFMMAYAASVFMKLAGPGLLVLGLGWHRCAMELLVAFILATGGEFIYILSRFRVRSGVAA